MSAYVVYDLICDHEQTARDYALCGAALSETETQELDKLPAHSRYIDTVNGVDIWYCYGADHYFFVEPARSTLDPLL